MPESQFKALETKIDDLINLCAQLNQENVRLKASAHSWAGEKQDLVARQQLAVSKVEVVLGRLKALEL